MIVVSVYWLFAAAAVAFVPPLVWAMVPRWRRLLLASAAGFFALAAISEAEAWPGWAFGVCALAGLALAWLWRDERRKARAEA